MISPDNSANGQESDVYTEKNTLLYDIAFLVDKTDENGNVIAGSSDGEETPATQASGAPSYQESDGTFAEDADGNRYYTDKKGNVTYNVDSYNYVDSNGEIITDGYGYIDPYTGAYIQ